MTDDGFKYLIDLPVQNAWENVDRMRTSVLGCFTAVFRDPDGLYSLAIVASELLENAIKYGAWGGDAGRLHLKVWGNQDEAHVQVENPVVDGDESVRELLQTIDWLNGFDDPEDAYRARILEIAAGPQGATKLGLARIAYEGRCRLAAEIDGGVLRVTGVTSLA